jgi:hypothetical protein
MPYHLVYWLQRLHSVGINAQWSVVNGVTLVLVVPRDATNVTVVASVITTVLFDATVTDGSFTASLDCLLQPWLAVSQFDGLHQLAHA